MNKIRSHRTVVHPKLTPSQKSVGLELITKHFDKVPSDISNQIISAARFGRRVSTSVVDYIVNNRNLVS